MFIKKELLEFRDSVREYLNSICSEAYLRDLVADKPKFDAELWNKLSEFGFLEFFSDQDNAQEMTAMLSLLAKEVGRSLLPSPLLSDLVVRNFLARRLNNNAEFISAITEAPVLLITELSSNLNIFDAATEQSTIVVLVKNLKRYEVIVVPANDSRRAVFNSIDLLYPKELIDSQILADDSLPRFLISKKDYEFFVNLNKLLAASQLAGIAEFITEKTLDYVKLRKQFNTELSSFQVIQHRLVDMHIVAEACDSLTTFAAWSANNSSEQFKLASYAAINYSSREVVLLIEDAIQLHGGIGFTWDYFLHWYLRRAQFLKGLSQTSASEVLKAVPI